MLIIFFFLIKNVIQDLLYITYHTAIKKKFYIVTAIVLKN